MEFPSLPTEIAQYYDENKSDTTYWAPVAMSDGSVAMVATKNSSFSNSTINCYVIYYNNAYYYHLSGDGTGTETYNYYLQLVYSDGNTLDVDLLSNGWVKAD